MYKELLYSLSITSPSLMTHERDLTKEDRENMQRLAEYIVDMLGHNYYFDRPQWFSGQINAVSNLQLSLDNQILPMFAFINEWKGLERQRMH